MLLWGEEGVIEKRTPIVLNNRALLSKSVRRGEGGLKMVNFERTYFMDGPYL